MQRCGVLTTTFILLALLSGFIDNGSLTNTLLGSESDPPIPVAISTSPPATSTPTPLSGSLTIIKEAPTANETELFGFSGDLADFSLAADEAITFDALSPGDYRVIENVLPGSWQLLAVSCNGQALTVETFAAPPVRVSLFQLKLVKVSSVSSIMSG